MSTPALFLLCTVIWGTTWYAITWQFGTVAPEVSVAYRHGAAALILAAACMATRRTLRFSPRDHAFVALQGMLMFGWSYLSIYWAEQHAASGLVAVLFTTMVFMSPVGMWLFFRQRLSARTFVAAALGVTGVALLFLPELRGLHRGGALALGVGFGLLAPLFSTAGNLVAVRNTRAGLPILSVTAIGMAYGAATAAAAALVQGLPWSFDPNWKYVASLMYLTLFGSIAAFAAYLTLLRRAGAGPAAFITVSTPVVAMLVSTLAEGYVWTPVAVAGAAVASAGNWLALRPNARTTPVE